MQMLQGSLWWASVPSWSSFISEESASVLLFVMVFVPFVGTYQA